jgi:hypothetical protein
MKFKNWGKFQHYSKRNPPWIKLHRSLLDDLDYYNMDCKATKLLPLGWLIASEKEGELPEIKELAFRLRIKEKELIDVLEAWRPYLDSYDSAALAPCKQDNTLETETEKETEKERKRASTIPKDFSISDSMKEWASNRVNGIDIYAQTEMFIDHHKSKGSSFVDWDAAWRKWMRNAKNWSKSSDPEPIQHTPKPKDLPDGYKWQYDASGNKTGLLKQVEKPH